MTDTTPAPIKHNPSRPPIRHHYIIAIILGGLALLLIGFIGGKAFEDDHIEHFLGWRENYEDNFFAEHNLHLPHIRIPMTSPSSPFVTAHTAFGQVLNINNSTLTIKDKNNTEQSVVTTSDTIIRLNNHPASFSDIKPNATVAVFGQPNGQGQIQAQFIRLFP